MAWACKQPQWVRSIRCCWSKQITTWQQDLVIPIENFLWCSPAYYLWFCLTQYRIAAQILNLWVVIYPLLSVYTFVVQVAQCVTWGLDVCCWCSFFLFIMYCPMAVASQCLSPEVLVRPGDCKVRAGRSFTLQLSPTAATGGAGREPVAQGVGASPAQWRRAGASPYPSPIQQNCCRDWLPFLGGQISPYPTVVSWISVRAGAAPSKV